ncbi:precorrin-6y C5,15-methyltransferase (decarboxylating), CbiE subunit [Aedoeadaptatus nemausensis]|uniref:Precorrin-6y C5,15-methyltransferase (Decarboxylating), CbiE subunit n=1 Tax=Aedoeadaptatus nemausensis TaxID=2582829 RepID=A0A6V6Y019_9FIRM|nr:precorrin-6y C5,15-methyltransferase (decarboxylating) subunit CbiE [Peptoniphilus nemausensis]CAC9925399.1 precorrin-6y C5,15-methyltransferase (decarboxylating), CbiE subunit [Peptoniphilus nemausensis]
MITLVGAGPGSRGSMTLDAVEAVRSADRVVAFPRLKESLEFIRKDIVEIHRISEVEDAVAEDHLAVVVSGDPLFYGLAATLKRRGVEIYRVVPGISSMQYAASKLQIPWHSMAFHSFHGREVDLDLLLDEKISCVLLDKHYSLTDLSEGLKEKGAEGLIHGASYLSYENEILETKSIGESFDLEGDLALGVIELALDE